MPVSRRGFLRGSLDTRSGAFIAARGLEAHLADAAQGANGARALVPPGVNEIRISSNENPLGPGKAVLDAILMKFPEAGRYPFNSTPNETALVAAIAGKFAVKPENIVRRRGIAGDPEERRARVHDAGARPRDRVPLVRELSGDRAAARSIPSPRSRSIRRSAWTSSR